MTKNELQVFSGKTEVSYVRFASIKMQLKLETKGLKSSGGPLRPRLAEEFGLKPRAPHADYIKYCEDMMVKLLADKVIANASSGS